MHENFDRVSVQCPGTCGSREFALVLHRRHDLQFLARAHSDVRVDTALQRGNAHEDTDSSNRHYAVPFDQRRAPLSQVLPPGLSQSIRCQSASPRLAV